MSFQAYLDNIQAKTGKTPAEFKAMARDKGFATEAGIAAGGEGHADHGLAEGRFRAGPRPRDGDCGAVEGQDGLKEGGD